MAPHLACSATSQGRCYYFFGWASPAVRCYYFFSAGTRPGARIYSLLVAVTLFSTASMHRGNAVSSRFSSKSYVWLGSAVRCYYFFGWASSAVRCCYFFGPGRLGWPVPWIFIRLREKLIIAPRKMKIKSPDALVHTSSQHHDPTGTVPDSSSWCWCGMVCRLCEHRSGMLPRRWFLAHTLCVIWGMLLRALAHASYQFPHSSITPSNRTDTRMSHPGQLQSPQAIK